MDIRKYLKNNVLITDGAMGTYFDSINQEDQEVAEKANFTNPQLIKQIHLEYINSGAKLIRTNTFATNHMLFSNIEEIKSNIRAAVSIANEAIEESHQEDIFCAASIGPIIASDDIEENSIIEEYKEICNTFLNEGIHVFVFETFSTIGQVKEISSYLKSKGDNFVIGQFIFNQMGYTKEGISVKRMIGEASSIDSLDAYGFNCGIGAAHLHELLKKVEFPNDKYVTALPNSGYPHVVRGRTIYSDSSIYFVEKMMEVVKLGANIVGGCCGTNPNYIEKLVKALKGIKLFPKNITYQTDIQKQVKFVNNSFIDKLNRGEKVIAVELDPPFNENADKLIEGAYQLKGHNVDLITIADSPLGRARADSIQMAIKVHNDTGIEVMPHICCRDKNKIAMRSQILGAHINGIRKILAITGDPIGPGDKNAIKGVFDFNSIKLMEYISDMNIEHFSKDGISYGGALNYSGANIDAIILRMKRKMDAGCRYFLTQPVYSPEDIERISYIKSKIETKILCGIMPLVSYKNAMFIKNEMPGIHVPDSIVDQYSPDMSREEAQDVAVSVAVKTVKELYNVADGYYFMTPFNRVSLIAKIIDQIS